MADVVWSDTALYELTEIRSYIAIFDAAAADRMVSRLLKAASNLADFPERGRPAGGGLREMTTVPPYILRYMVDGETVSIVRVRHGARRPD